MPRQPKGITCLRTLLRQIKGLEGKGRRCAQSQKIVVVVVEVVVRLLNYRGGASVTGLGLVKISRDRCHR